ncbi:MAG: IclR family transcriptional regulator [Pseudomonadota bacterium]
MDGQETAKIQGIQVISRAAGVLRALSREPGGLSLGQIASRVGLPRSTVQRIVAALALEGFISTEKGFGGIRLGPEIQGLARATATDMRERLRPVMEEISRSTGETVDMAMLTGDRMLFVDQIVGSQRLRTVSSIGESFPLTTTANGKAALACMEPARATALIAQESTSRHTGGRPLSALFAEIEAIRTGSLARDEDEHTEGISALGFALADPRGDIFAVSVPVPSTRFARINADLAEVIARCLKEADL